jgi:rSAM/selenodomain-associated transferase 1
MRPALVVMARAPRLGTVKTRLAATVGDVAALAAYRILAERTLAAAHASGIPITVCVAPGSAIPEMAAWLGPTPAYAAQAEGDLGTRMAEAIAARLGDGSDGVVVIGTDCPDVSAATLRSALDALDNADVVFGPAMDGGYYLVAMRTLARALFQDIPWSSDRTLAESLCRADALALRVALLEPLRDVDTGDDWRWFSERL